jgi:lysozyme
MNFGKDSQNYLGDKMNIYELLKQHEGIRRKPYKCSMGFKTIGVGWNIDANPLPLEIADHLKVHGEITDAMVDNLLSISVGHATADCRDLFPTFDEFSDRRKMALIDFTFQLGKKGVSRFVNSVACINTGRWDDAAENMLLSAWARQTPNRAADIIQMIQEG